MEGVILVNTVATADVINMKKVKKLSPKLANSEVGYYILSPIYAGIDGNYLSHWQQSSPYYYRLGNLLKWIEKNIKSQEVKNKLINEIKQRKHGN